MKRLAVFAVILLVPPMLPADHEIPPRWQTIAERSDFRATSSYDETIAFLRRCQARAPQLIRVTDFGRSGQGRPLPLVIVSSEGAFTPEAAVASGKPVLLLQSCIHAGEVDGKVASLMLLREIALGRRPDLAAAATVLFVPIYNADGHERVSAFNRPNQNGPVEGTGYRTTASGINLNRDFLRVASPEGRAMARLVSRWRPHLHVDNHVTNGSDHAWVLTWLVPEAPLLPPAVDAWVKRHLPPVLERTRAAGHPSGPYVSLVDGNDPSRGMEWDMFEPRYSSNYFPLRNRASILIEMHAHKPFRDRVLANRDFMAELILEAGRAGRELTQAIRAAESHTIALGLPDAEPSPAVLRWQLAKSTETVRWPAFEWTVEESIVMGGPRVQYQPGKIREVEMTWRRAIEVQRSVPRPRGYVVLAGWPQIEEVVAAHGLEVRLVTEATTLDVETIRVAGPTLASMPYQGTVMVEDFSVSRQSELVRVPAGSLWIPADQPDFELAVQLFEPEAPDSLVRWGAVSSVFERKVFIGLDVLERLAREMLADDEIRIEWERALENETFVTDRMARYLWWYRRTPYWDDSVGLLPILRVMTAPDPALATDPGEMRDLGLEPRPPQ